MTSDDGDTSNIATTIAVVRSAYLFQIPAKSSAMGHNAESWPKKAMWIGRLKIVSTAKQCTLRFENIETDALYLSVPININPEKPDTIDPCFDSSRYFALSVIKPGTEDDPQYFELGLGFQTRDESMDFKMGIAEFDRVQQNLEEARQFNLRPSENFALDDNEILDIKPMKKSKKKTTVSANSNVSFEFMPPPSDSVKSKKKKKKTDVVVEVHDDGSASSTSVVSDELFGDFTSSTEISPASDNNNNADDSWATFD